MYISASVYLTMSIEIKQEHVELLAKVEGGSVHMRSENNIHTLQLNV
jgi:hypothetical protein